MASFSWHIKLDDDDDHDDDLFLPPPSLQLLLIRPIKKGYIWPPRLQLGGTLQLLYIHEDMPLILPCFLGKCLSCHWSRSYQTWVPQPANDTNPECHHRVVTISFQLTSSCQHTLQTCRDKYMCRFILCNDQSCSTTSKESRPALSGMLARPGDQTRLWEKEQQ